METLIKDLSGAHALIFAALMIFLSTLAVALYLNKRNAMLHRVYERTNAIQILHETLGEKDEELAVLQKQIKELYDTLIEKEKEISKLSTLYKTCTEEVEKIKRELKKLR